MAYKIILHTPSVTDEDCIPFSARLKQKGHEVATHPLTDTALAGLAEILDHETCDRWGIPSEMVVFALSEIGYSNKAIKDALKPALADMLRSMMIMDDVVSYVIASSDCDPAVLNIIRLIELTGITNGIILERST